ncbi:MAG: hypothetical protein U0234_09670 [Sandaracinus sp.]
MRARGLSLARGVLVASLFALGCAEWECGYGGPGCSAPGLQGVCGGQLVREAPTDVRVVYFDDTGAHEARVTSVDASDAIEVAQLSMGRFRLTGHVDGATTLTMQIEGWAAPQHFDLVIAAGDAGAPDASASADAGCAGVRGR